MLRITTIEDPGRVTFQLEGRLTGPWVDELDACWTKTAAERGGREVCVDLRGVTFIDGAGRALLHRMHVRHVALMASCCLTKALVAEIQGSDRKDQSSEGKDQK